MNHAQGKVLKACPGWVLQQGLAASARWLNTASCSCWVQALATLPHTSAPFSHVQFLHLLLGCRHCARGVRGLRVPLPLIVSDFLWALPECASGGTGNTRRERCLRLVLVGFSNRDLPQARAGSTLRSAVVGFRPWPPCHTPPLPSVMCSSIYKN